MFIVGVQVDENFGAGLCLTRTGALRRAFIGIFLELLYVELAFGLIFEGLVTDFVWPIHWVANTLCSRSFI